MWLVFWREESHERVIRLPHSNTGTKRQEESEYVLKFENEEEEEEEEKDSWQIRLERFQDEESMMCIFIYPKSFLL